MLMGMGFYQQLGNGHYRMALPTPTLKTVKAAVAKYAATEDEHCRLHPEWLGGVDKFNPDSDAGKQHEGGEALHQLVVAGGDAA